ncbi:MAG: laminin G domain-containing protein [Armatimonadetes bacterium]|nr:laminin G domain-containing protein [Armatimonadota bacterium]
MSMRCPALLVLVALRAASAASWCQVVAPDGSPPLVRQAALELAGYLGRLADADVSVRSTEAKGVPAVLLQLNDDPNLGEEEFFIEPAGKGRVTLRARTPVAVLEAAYRLLREYGCGFYFDGDALPAGRPAAFLTPTVHGKPVFAVRGSLPWYNFLDSPTTWDAQDFRFFADQILRSGQNFIGFHTYDYEPFGAYEYNGQTPGGEPLMTTANHVWGTFPMRVDEFGFGTGRFFPGVYWGSDAARAEGTREERLKLQKALLADGLAYASARGVKTCLGFEVGADPTDPAEQRRFRARLTQLVRDYPMLDYVWLWQPEGMSMQGSTPPPLRSQGGRVYRDWLAAFDYVKDPKRAWEGMRVGMYGELAREILDGAAPSVKLVLSGWGGDHWLRVSDYFPAWDKVLDKRIIFAALDDIRVSPQVSANYQLSPDRERWAIPWYEYDGDQWVPQADTAIFANTVRDTLAKGCQGQLAIHWRTKEVGESQALCAQFAWNPEESLEAFYRDYGTRRIGPAQGPAYGDVLRELDALSYRWIGGGGQTECGTFGWSCSTEAAKLEAVTAARVRLIAIRAAVAKGPAPVGALGRVDDIIATIDRLLGYNRVAAVLVPGGPVDQALAKPEDAKKMLDELTGPAFGEVLDGYARTITSRGELGILATVNGKAFYQLRAAVARLAGAAGTPAPDLTGPNRAHRGLLSDYQLTSVAAGQPLPVRCMAYAGDKPASRVALQYRAPGDRDWTSLPMANTERSVFEAVIPAEAVKAGWLRYRISAELPGGRLDWPALRGEPYRQVTIFPADTLVSRRNPVDMEPKPPPAGATLTARADPLTVRLAWGPWPGLADVTVQRRADGGEWQPLGATLDRQYEDAAAPASAKLDYRLVDAAGQVAATAAVETPAAPLPPVPGELTCQPRGPSVRLHWTGGDLAVAGYGVERAAAAAGPFEPVAGLQNLPPVGYDENGATDRPKVDGKLWYRVVAHGRGGTASPSEPVEVSVSTSIPKPVVNLEFDSPDVAGPTGPAEFSGPHEIKAVDGRGALVTDGGLALPYGDKLSMTGPFTAAIRFRLREQTPIPVLMSQGRWQGDGWFVQVFYSQVRFYCSGAGCLDRPWECRLNEWHTLVCVYDGTMLAAYADGVLIGEQRAAGEPTAAKDPFTVARYADVGPQWKVVGDIDFARLYDQPLEPWMVIRGTIGPFATTTLDWSAPPQADWRQPQKLVDTAQGKAVDLEGGLVIPIDEAHLAGDTLSVETSFNLRSVEGMPVLLNQGMWPLEGWMVQVLGKRLRLHVGGAGSLDCGPEIETGRWYKLKFTYDGATARAWLDGEPIGERGMGVPMAPSIRPLRVGCYELDQAAYVAHG